MTSCLWRLPKLSGNVSRSHSVGCCVGPKQAWVTWRKEKTSYPAGKERHFRLKERCFGTIQSDFSQVLPSSFAWASSHDFIWKWPYWLNYKAMHIHMNTRTWTMPRMMLLTHRLLTESSGFNIRWFHLIFVVDEVALKRVFLSVRLSPSSVTFHHSSIIDVI